MNPCITCTKQGGTEKKMMPIIDEHEPAFFERPFRTQATNAPRGSGRERHFSSMLWRQRRLERLPSSILHFRGGAEGTSRAFRGSGTDSSGTCRAFFGSGARSGVHFEPAAGLGQARAAISRASCGSGPGSSGHFEPAAAPGQARAAISSQQRLRARLDVANVGRCGVFEPGPSRVRPEPSSESPKARKSENRRKL